MADKLTLTSFGSLQQDSSATADLNANNAAIVTAMNNTLSRDGASPNQMNAALDMNSNSIINLPEPVNGSEPLRLLDVALLNGGGTLPVQALPTGGTDGQVLTKQSAGNYDVIWENTSFSLSPGQVTGVDIASNTVANANLAQAFPATIKGNPTAITANEQDFSIASLTDIVTPNTTNDYMIIQDSVSGTLKKINTNSISGALTAGVGSIDGKLGAFTTGNGLETNVNLIQLSAARRTNPTIQTLTASAGTYTTPTNCIFIKAKVVAGGGGGAGVGNPSGVNGVNGASSSFNGIIANAGNGGNTNNAGTVGSGGAGGNSGSGTAQLRISGGIGGTGVSFSAGTAGLGGSGGGTVWGQGPASAIGSAGSSGIGCGGSGSGTPGAANVSGGGGGGGGEYIEVWISNPGASYAYTVGAGGGGGGAGAAGAVGGSGNNGRIYVEEYYNS